MTLVVSHTNCDPLSQPARLNRCSLLLYLHILATNHRVQLRHSYDNCPPLAYFPPVPRGSRPACSPFKGTQTYYGNSEEFRADRPEQSVRYFRVHQKLILACRGRGAGDSAQKAKDWGKKEDNAQLGDHRSTHRTLYPFHSTAHYCSITDEFLR